MAGQGKPLHRTGLELPLLEYWYRALHEPLGVKFATNDVRKARAHLYKARADARDPELDQLALVVSPVSPETEIFIMRKDADAPAVGRPRKEPL